MSVVSSGPISILLDVHAVCNVKRKEMLIVIALLLQTRTSVLFLKKKS